MVRNLSALIRVCLLLFIAMFFCRCQNAKVERRVLTFNIRMDNLGDSLNRWGYRKENVIEFLNKNNFALIGMQEVKYNQLKNLEKGLPSYSYIGVGRTDGKHKGEHCPIFYDEEVYHLLDSGNFSLSEDPTRFGIKSWGAGCERIATWGIFQDRKNGKKIAMFNTHLDHVSDDARRKGIEVVLQQIDSLQLKMPILLTGDFNCSPNTTPWNAPREQGFEDVSLLVTHKSGPQWSFHSFGDIEIDERPLIDYIFLNGDIQVDDYCVIAEQPRRGYYSDHNPISVNISYE